MRYSFRLAQLLHHDPDPKKRPGTVKAIVEQTGLGRHTIAAMLRNEVKNLPLDAISRICGYLIDNRIAAAEDLPGALFGVEPENFWELLARRTRLHICVGMRQDPETDYLDDAWVATADALLLGVLLNGVSTLGGTARYFPQGERPSAKEGPVARAAPHPDEYVQRLVLAPQEGNQGLYPAVAQRVYREFDQLDKDKALVSLGSVKSNPVIELILAQAFRVEPFVSQDQVARACDRGCPIWLRFRDGMDFGIPSCGGGTRLSATEAASEPGIYFERDDGTWTHCGWDKQGRDAGLIFYHYVPAQGRLEMAVGGFSSRATRFLSQVLTPTFTSQLWPPTYDTPSLQIGAYVVRFACSENELGNRDILTGRYAGEIEVIPLAREVIARRVER